MEALQGIPLSFEGAAIIRSWRYKVSSWGRVNTITASKAPALQSLISWEQQKKRQSFPQLLSLKSLVTDCSTQEAVPAVYPACPQDRGGRLGARGWQLTAVACLCLPAAGLVGKRCTCPPKRCFCPAVRPSGDIPTTSAYPELCCGELTFHLWC